MKEIREGLISFGDDEWRLELGWRRLEVTASEKVLRGTGRAVPTKDGPPVHDAAGKPVTMGKPMTILDRTRANRVWYLYRWDAAAPHPKQPDEVLPRFVEVKAIEGSQVEAIAAALAEMEG